MLCAPLDSLKGVAECCFAFVRVGCGRLQWELPRPSEWRTRGWLVHRCHGQCHTLQDAFDLLDRRGMADLDGVVARVSGEPREHSTSGTAPAGQHGDRARGFILVGLSGRLMSSWATVPRLRRRAASSRDGTTSAASMLSQIPAASSFPRRGTASPPTTPAKRHNGRFTSPAFPRVATERTSHGIRPANSHAARKRLTKMSVNTAPLG